MTDPDPDQPPDLDLEVRAARPEDVDPVAAFTAETWAGVDRHGSDHMPEVFPRWVASTDPDRRSLVAERDGDPVGTLQTALLTEWEAWTQGLRVHPDHRGTGVASALMEAGLAWARERDAVVCRGWVYGWNVPGIGLSRAAGLDPVAEFRWARPDPDPDPEAGGDQAVADPNAAWAHWRDSGARDALAGLSLDPDETWALSDLTRRRLREAAADGRLLSARGPDGARATAHRVRTAERGGERIAEYGGAAWEEGAFPALRAAVAADAAAAGADGTRVLVPETPRHVGAVAAARVDLADVPDFAVAGTLD